MNEMISPAAAAQERGALDYQRWRREFVPVLRNTRAIPRRPWAQSCLSMARPWRRNRLSICKCRGVPIHPRWITSPTLDMTAGASIWRAMAAPPRTAITMRRYPKGQMIVTWPPYTSRNCAATAPFWSTEFPRARCVRRCSPSGIRKWWHDWRSMPWSGLAKARLRSSSGARSSPSSRRQIGVRSTRLSFARCLTATIQIQPNVT